MSELAIETHGLHMRFGATIAVADLSLSVRRGDVFGFLGPNGAGKTTSIKMLLGLIKPTSGAGSVLRSPIGDRKARSRIGFLPEHFRLHEYLTARELLRFHGRLCGRRDRSLESRIDLLLARVDLLDAADRQFRHYSKGMQQRAGLAQALINEPDLLFLDEPTSGMDPLGRRLVRDLVGELRTAGVTVFVNSHLLSEIEATCDRVAFLRDGRIVRELTLSDVATGTNVEIDVTPIDEALVADLSAFATQVMRTGERRIRLRATDEATVPDIVHWLVMRGAAVHRVDVAGTSLEEWFVDTMGEDQRLG